MGAAQAILQNPIGALVGSLLVALAAELFGRWLSGRRRRVAPARELATPHRISNSFAVGTQEVNGESRTNQNVTNTGHVDGDLSVTSVDSSRTSYDQRVYHRTEVRGTGVAEGDGPDIALVLFGGFVVAVVTAGATVLLAKYWDSLHLWSVAVVLGAVILVSALGRGAPQGPGARPGNPVLCALLGVLIVVVLAVIPGGSRLVPGFEDVAAGTSGLSLGDGIGHAMETIGAPGLVVYLVRFLGLGVLIALFLKFVLRALGAGIVARDVWRGRPAQESDGRLRKLGAQRLGVREVCVLAAVMLIAGAAAVPGAAEGFAGAMGELFRTVAAALA